MDLTKQIEDQYAKELAAQKAQLKAGYDQSAAAYQKQMADAAGQYQQLKNEAYVNNALAERARQENVANMGLSGEGGSSQTLQQRNTAALLEALGSASRQQQDYTDNVNMALASLAAKYGADAAGIEAKNASSLSDALMKQNQWQADFDLKAQKMREDERQNIFKQAYNLYLKRLITAAQFQAMTGVSLKRA